MNLDNLYQELGTLLASNPARGAMKVILAKDGEGNGYSPLDSIGLDLYLAENAASGELLHSSEAALYSGVEDVLVFWPVN